MQGSRTSVLQWQSRIVLVVAVPHRAGCCLHPKQTFTLPRVASWLQTRSKEVFGSRWPAASPIRRSATRAGISTSCHRRVLRPARKHGGFSSSAIWGGAHGTHGADQPWSRSAQSTRRERSLLRSSCRTSAPQPSNVRRACKHATNLPGRKRHRGQSQRRSTASNRSMRASTEAAARATLLGTA